MSEESNGVVQIGPAEFEQGYRGACARFREETYGDSLPGLFVPLFEALNWAVALADNLKSSGAPLDDPVVKGLRFVRNRVHHQWVAALEVRKAPRTYVVYASGHGSGAVWPPDGYDLPPDEYDWPPVGYDWHWKPVSCLLADNVYPDPTGEEAYVVHLADRPARRALDRLEQIIVGHAGEAAPQAANQ